MAMHDPEEFQKFTESTWSGVKRVFTDYKEKFTWKENESILDVGCGTGQVISNLLKEGFLPDDSIVVAADIAEEMIEFGKKLVNNSRVTFKKLDILDNDLWKTFKKEEFSKIFCFYVLHRLSDDRKAYENIYNLLKPGGETLIFYPSKHGVDDITQYLAKLPKFSKYAEELLKVHFADEKDHVSYQTEQFKKNGFENYSCKLMNMHYKFPSVDYITDLYGLITPLDKFMPKEVITDVLKEVETLVKETNFFETTDDGGVIIRYEVIIGFAKKPL